MSEVTLPHHLTTESKIGAEQVPVELQTLNHYSPEDIDKLKNDLGMIAVTGGRLQAIRDVGLNIEALGFLRYLKGGVVLSSAAVLETIGQLKAVMADPAAKTKDKVSAAATIASLNNSLVKSATGAVKNESAVLEAVTKMDEQKRNHFRPGINQPGNPILA